MTDLKITFDWFPNTIHTGVLLAKKRGWYEKEGIDLTIHGEVHAAMDPSSTDMICGPEISMLTNRNKGRNLTGIATFTQKCDSGIVSLKESNITRPRDLEGKRLTHWELDWYHPSIGYLVEKDGGDYSKVKFVPMDVGDIVATLGTIADATWVYEDWEKYALLAAGKEVNYFNLGDIDPIFNFCAPAVGATDNAIQNKAEALKAFLAVTERGYQEAAKDPGLVLEVKEMIPEASCDEMLVEGAKHLSEIWLDEAGKWGRIRPEMWNPMADFLVEKGLIRERTPEEFTNRFFEEA